MTLDEEEKRLAGMLVEARAAVKQAKEAKKRASDTLADMEQYEADIHQAIIDYMDGNGLLECESFTIRKSYAVDIEDLDAVPEDYLRFKTTTEADKIKIRDHRPAGNWYVMRENKKVVVKV